MGHGLRLFTGRPVGTVLLPGKTEPLKLFEPLSAERMESPAIKAYLDAFTKLEAGVPSANQAFAAVVGEFSDDPLATYHLKRTLMGEAGVNIVLSEK